MAQLYAARKSFVVDRRDRKVYINKGDIAEEGSWPLSMASELFSPIKVRFTAPDTSKPHRKLADKTADKPADEPADDAGAGK
jgi:hypothetical protein